MTRPTDAAIALAFWEACEEVGDGYIDELYVVSRAAEFDAESPAGTDASIVNAAKAVIRRWDSPLWRQEVGTADLINDLREAIDNAQEVTAPAERVQIPAESKRVCTVSTCRAEMRPGLRCGSPHCGLKE